MVDSGNKGSDRPDSFLRLVPKPDLNEVELDGLDESHEEEGEGLYDKSVMKEKQLAGNTVAILKLVETDDLAGDLAEGVRLCLFGESGKSCSIFGGQNSGKITPAQYDLLYTKIHTEGGFYELSDRVRSDAKSIFKVVNGK